MKFLIDVKTTGSFAFLESCNFYDFALKLNLSRKK